MDSESQMHHVHASSPVTSKQSGNKEDAESEIGSLPKSTVSVCDGVGAACAAHAHTEEDQEGPAGNPTDGHARKGGTKVHPPKLATSNGRRVGNGRNVSAGKGSRGGGPPRTPLPGGKNWRGSQED